jgi:hypothetical protein
LWDIYKYIINPFIEDLNLHYHVGGYKHVDNFKTPLILSYNHNLGKSIYISEQ